MPRRINKKCEQCAKLTIEEAIALNGPEGENCWEPSICHRKRSHYRHRDDNNAIRRRLRRHGQPATVGLANELIEVIVPALQTAPAAVLVLYRQNANAPVHAVAAEVWRGDQKIAEVKATHCMGMKGDRVSAYIKEILVSLNQQFEVARFEDVIKEIAVERCPIANCPLKA